MVALAALASVLAEGSETRRPSALADPELRMIAAGPAASAIRLAREGAARRLARPECAQVFGDFTDASGRPLQAQLDAFRLGGPDYLSLVFFADGLDRGRCEDDRVLATATPGGRVVSICRRFNRAYMHDPRWAELILIHEALHTLGL